MLEHKRRPKEFAMTATTPDIDDFRLSPFELFKIWVRHLSSLLIPLTTIAFLWTGPHAWYIAPLFMLPLIYALTLDQRDTVELRQPLESTPAWPFDLIVYLLTALQFLMIYMLSDMFSRQGFFSIDTIMVIVVVGGNSGFSIITAHELIHRKRPWEQWLGRLILATALQEHFFTEHLRGHHSKVGQADDPATARFGESYNDFYKRTVPGQIKSAWHLEKRRLGDPDMSLFDKRMIHNRLLHGVTIGWGIGFAILAGFGVVPFMVYILQAFMASRLLEAVNYFEHWGLRRRTRNVRPIDSWDTHSWFTYYGLTGLSRHADHHAEQTRPYQQLRVFEDVPVLPTGYIGLVDMVMERNDDFQKHAVGELKRRELGPYSADTPAEEREAAEVIASEILARKPPEQGGPFGPLPQNATGWVRRIAIFSVIALMTAGAVSWEIAGDTSLLLERFVLHIWILGSIWAAIRIRFAVKESSSSENLSWTTAMAALFALGTFATSVVGLPV